MVHTQKNKKNYWANTIWLVYTVKYFVENKACLYANYVSWNKYFYFIRIANKLFIIKPVSKAIKLVS